MMWFIYAPFSFAFALLAAGLSPLIALFVREDGYLPRWLWWFQTPDNPAIGDAQYRSAEMVGVTSRWWLATCWLARNPGQGLDEALGAHIKEGFIYQSSGDELTNNTPLHNGWVWRTVVNPDMSYYWNLYAVYAWSDRYCLKVNLGWRLWTFNPQDVANAAITGEKAQGLEAGQVRRLAVTPNPFTKYTRSP